MRQTREQSGWRSASSPDRRPPGKTVRTAGRWWGAYAQDLLHGCGVWGIPDPGGEAARYVPDLHLLEVCEKASLHVWQRGSAATVRRRRVAKQRPRDRWSYDKKKSRVTSNRFTASRLDEFLIEQLHHAGVP